MDERGVREMTINKTQEQAIHYPQIGIFRVIPLSDRERDEYTVGGSGAIQQAEPGGKGL